MKKEYATKLIAESLRGIYEKLDALHELTGFEVYEYFSDLDGLLFVLAELLDIPPWDSDRSLVYDFLRGEFEYDDLLAKVKEARVSFDPEEYDRFLDAQKRLFDE